MNVLLRLRRWSRVNALCLVVVLTHAQALSPQYIFNPSKVLEFPDCDVKYAGVCAVQIAIGLIDASINAACANLATDATSGLNYLQLGSLVQSMPGRNIGTFVLKRSTGERLVDTWVNGSVGTFLDNKLVYSAVSEPTLLSQFQAAVDDGGGWIPHQWRWSAGGTAVPVLSYVKRCPVDTGHIIGTTIGREPLPADVNSPDTFISMGTIKNAQRLVGMTTTDILAARTMVDFERVVYDLVFSRKYKVESQSWYVFMAKVGDVDSTGLEAVGNSRGIIVAHPISIFPGKNVSEFRKFLGASQGIIDQGEALNVALLEAAVAGGEWVDYVWGPLDALYYKVSYTVGVWVGRQKYGVGAGFTMKALPALSGPSCTTCSAFSNNACAALNSLNLLSSALAMALTRKSEHDLWRYISHGYSDAYTSLSYSMSGGFYVFVFDYNGTCVADASEPSNIGKTLSQLTSHGTDSTALNSQFITAADMGGMWVKYPWKTSTNSYNKLAYIRKMYKYSKQFYMGVAFADVTPPVDAQCSALYAEPCAEYSVHRLVGEANAALLGAADASETVTILQQIATSTSNGGFVVHPYDENFECPPALMANNAAQCPPVVTSTVKKVLMALTKSKSNGGWDLLQSGTQGSHGLWAYVLPVNARFGNIILYSSVVDNNAPRCTGNCPAHSTCMSGRCVCVPGWRPSYANTGGCGTLTAKSMTCVDQSMQLCTNAGMGISGSMGRCQNCTAGKYKPGTLVTELSPCLACPAGEISDTVGATACKTCGAGKYSDVPASSTCKACPTGSYAPGIGRTSCIPCPPGSYSDQPGSASCKDCSRGKYQADSFSTECHRCPSTMETTPAIGSISISACVCKKSMYRPRGGKPGTECNACPEGMTCDEGSAEDALFNTSSQGLAQPLLMTGYWSSISQPMVTFLCVDDTEDSPCGGGVPPGCNGLLIGTVCSQCPYGYKVGDADCDECDGWQTAIVSIFFALVLIGPIFMMRVLVPNHTWRINAIQTVSMTCEVLIEFGQTMASVTALRITWPAMVQVGLDLFEGLPFKLYALDPVSSFDCFAAESLRSDFTKYLGMTVVIPGIAAYMGVLYPICSRWLPARWRWDFHTTVHIILKFVNLVFVSQVFLSFAPFQCYSHPGENPKTSVQSFAATFCGTSEHASLLVVGFMSVGFCTGFFAYLVWETHQFKKRFTCRSDPEALTLYIRRVTFILEDFRLETYYWNLVSKVLEFLIGGIFIAMIPNSTRAQIFIYIFVFANCIFLWGTFTPFKIPLLNLAISIICGILILILVLAATQLPTATGLDTDITSAFLSSAMCIEFFMFAVLLVIAYVTLHLNGPHGNLFAISHMATIPSEEEVLELWEEARKVRVAELSRILISWQSHELRELVVFLLRFEALLIGRTTSQRVSFRCMDPKFNMTQEHILSVCKSWNEQNEKLSAIVDEDGIVATVDDSLAEEARCLQSNVNEMDVVSDVQEREVDPTGTAANQGRDPSKGEVLLRTFSTNVIGTADKILGGVPNKRYDVGQSTTGDFENGSTDDSTSAQDVSSTYIVQSSGGLAVHATINWKFGTKVAELCHGTIIEALEIEKFKDRIRARIASPEGWISIKSTDGSREFAVKVLGTYIVQLKGGMAVHTTINWKLGAKVAELDCGTIVEVLEFGTFKDRVRARIASPAGWISIKSTDGSQEFAVKAEQKEAKHKVAVLNRTENKDMDESSEREQEQADAHKPKERDRTTKQQKSTPKNGAEQRTKAKIASKNSEKRKNGAKIQEHKDGLKERNEQADEKESDDGGNDDTRADGADPDPCERQTAKPNRAKELPKANKSEKDFRAKASKDFRTKGSRKDKAFEKESSQRDTNDRLDHLRSNTKDNTNRQKEGESDLKGNHKTEDKASVENGTVSEVKAKTRADEKEKFKERDKGKTKDRLMARVENKNDREANATKEFTGKRTSRRVPTSPGAKLGSAKTNGFSKQNTRGRTKAKTMEEKLLMQERISPRSDAPNRDTSDSDFRPLGGIQTGAVKTGLQRSWSPWPAVITSVTSRQYSHLDNQDTL